MTSKITLLFEAYYKMNDIGGIMNDTFHKLLIHKPYLVSLYKVSVSH